MDPRKIMLVGGGFMLLVVMALMAKNLFGAAAPAAVKPAVAAAPSGPEVLVATRTLPAGTILTPDAYRFQPWPGELIDKAYYLKSEGQQQLAGTVVRFPIAAGQPLTQGSVVKPGDRGFLAAALGPGMRAVTITVSAQSGVAGFVFPGDRIDLLLTQTVSGEGQPLRASETIVRNLRVLATDQRTDKTVDGDGKTQVATFSTVTLEATPKLAEKIAVAETIGSLSLSLRSISDDRMELERQIADGEVSLPDTGNASEDKKLLAEVASRPVDADATFTTGGQVSRFQRNSVPASGSAPAPAPAPVAAPAGPPRPRGPLVTVARGQAVTVTPVAGVF